VADIEADVVALQEVDYLLPRTGEVDQAAVNASEMRRALMGRAPAGGCKSEQLPTTLTSDSSPAVPLQQTPYRAGRAQPRWLIA
jgi:endonuclease/exonuclease/phosphatase family metal-dependent hydrolase